jgi:hypothetical protein
VTVRSNPALLWRAAAVVGVLLILIGIIPAYVEVATHFSSELFSTHYEILLLLILIGVVMSFFGLIGWAKQVQRSMRVRMAVIIFIAPWIAALVGYPIAGNNVHGPGALVMMLVIPASVLALVLLYMSAVPQPPADAAQRTGPVKGVTYTPSEIEEFKRRGL